MRKWILVALAAWGLAVPWARATDIDGVQYYAWDQPQIHMLLRASSGSDPIIIDGTDAFGDPVQYYDIQGFLDTGTSGVLLSQETASAFNMQPTVVNGAPVVFGDIGIGGTVEYNVSSSFYVSVASYSVDNNAVYGAPPPPLEAYTTNAGPIRFQMGTTPSDELIGPLDIIGMPVIQGHVAVFDTRLDTSDPDLLPFMRGAYLYNPNTPFRPNTLDTDPGIVPVNHHVKLTFADFSRFTVTSVASEAPSLARNPMIGPDPVAKDPNDHTPPVKLSLSSLTGRQTTGSFLFDTGATTSFISSNIAAALNVRYTPGTEGTANPALETYDPAHPENAGTAIANTFTLQLGGVGGAATVAGFYLDSLELTTEEGDPLKFLNAPVAILDITLTDADGNTLTLDGDLGVNFWFASTSDSVGGIAPFDWVVFDEPNQTLGFQFAGDPVPEPTVGGVLLIAATAGLLRRRVRRAA